MVGHGVQAAQGERHPQRRPLCGWPIVWREKLGWLGVLLDGRVAVFESLRPFLNLQGVGQAMPDEQFDDVSAFDGAYVLNELALFLLERETAWFWL